MIRNDSEYKRAVERVKEESIRLKQSKEQLKEKGLNDEEIKRVMDPVESFHLQLKEEVETYEKLKQGIFDDLINLRGVGHLLVCLRIARGYTQRELADKLEVNESQVSRDERNEYHGITLERASKILEALGATLLSKVEISQTLEAA